MFKLRNLYILCTKLAHFKCDACYRSQNSWDGRTFTMVQHLLFFSEQFEDVWASRLWVWCWNLVPFLPDIGFQLLKSLWSSDVFFCLMMPQMFSIGERSGLQAGQFSTQTFLLQSHAVVIAAECSFALSYWNTCCLDLYTPFSIHIAFENMQAAHTVCTYAAPYHQRCWLLCVWPAAISSCSPRLVTHWR